VLVVVVVAGTVVVRSVVVVLVCANAKGATAAQANPIMSFFMFFPPLWFRFFDLTRVEIIQSERTDRSPRNTAALVRGVDSGEFFIADDVRHRA